MNEEDIFQAALAKSDPAERRAYLDSACGGDATLRQRVEALLRSHEEALSFLNVPALEQGARPTPERTEPVGQQPGAAPAPADQTAAEVAVGGDEALAFLRTSQKPGGLGRLAHYEIQEVIGRGGMGVVLKALDEKLQRVVAVKVLAPQLASSGAARQRFLREARSAAAVVHEHVVTIHAVDEADGVPYLVMECIDGQSLQEKLDREGPLPLKETLRIAVQAAEGLAAAHKRGLVHRDVKPANILLENGVERVKLTDFGLARAMDDASLTQSGVIAGTPMFMSPEQAAGERLDHRSDLFSLGSVLYAMCTGRAPFRASSTMAVLKRVCEETPRPVREINPETPEWLAEVIAKLHAKKPEDRYPSAQAVADLLGARLAELQASGRVLPVAAAAPAAPKPALRRRSWKAALVGLLLLGAIGAVVALWLLWSSDSPPSTPGDQPEPQNPPAVVNDSKEPFAVLAKDGRAEQTFPTLKDAVEKAQSGDAIEIRGDGPFPTEPIDLDAKKMTIRAGEGNRPVIVLAPAFREVEKQLISSNSLLVLEGLDLRTDGKAADGHLIFVGESASLVVQNCRLMSTGPGASVNAHCLNVAIRNSFVVGCGVNWAPAPRGKMVVERSVLFNRVQLQRWRMPTEDFSLVLRESTLLGSNMGMTVNWEAAIEKPEPKAIPVFHINASGCVIHGRYGLLQFWSTKPSPDRDVLRFLGTWKWTEGMNLFGPERPFLYSDGQPYPKDKPVRFPEDWKAFWKSDSIPGIAGEPIFDGGDLFARHEEDPLHVQPADFRLAPASPGKGKGEGGKDLGADVDKVGPGKPYEEWRKTPEYEEWRKQTAQMLAAAPG